MSEVGGGFPGPGGLEEGWGKLLLELESPALHEN